MQKNLGLVLIVLRSSHPPKPNLTKAQNSALRELERDRDHIILTADKGVAMVIMDRQDYINKANTCHIVIPYTQGLCESIKKICGRSVAFKPTSKVAAPSIASWSPQGQRPYGQPK